MTADKSTAVAVLAPPRLPYHPAIEERFGIDRAAWKALVESVWPLAKTSDAVALALSYCRARKLDPFKKPVHIVPMWNSALSREVETVWPGISEHRTTAFRTSQYAGADETVFGPRIEMAFEGATKKGEKIGPVKVRFPEWAQITVYRMLQGQKIAFPGPRTYWEEVYSGRKGTTVPNDRWCRAPSQMLEKCAEAAALRKAFPEELGNEPIAEEMEDKMTTIAHHVLPAEPRPTRASVLQATDTPPEEAEAANRDLDRQAMAAVDGTVSTDEPPTVDPETGEIIETKADAPKVSAATGRQPAILPPLRADGNQVAWANDAIEVIGSVLPRVLAEIEEEMKNIPMIDGIHGQLARAIAARRKKP